MNWLYSIVSDVWAVVALALTGIIVAWLKGFLNSFLPPPARAWLALENSWRDQSQRPEDGFRIVLCWLEDDSSGDDTATVAQAFQNVHGVRLVRSARIVTASGAGGDWRPAMENSAHAVLEDWNADLAIVGLVKGSREALSLWFVPRLGENTLDRGDRPYKLENVTLGDDFHDDLRAQVTAMALTAVAPLADTEARGRVLEKGLRDATDKLARLLDRSTIVKGEHRAALHVALGNALQTLGERENDPARLEQAVAAYHAALEEYSRDRAPHQWALTQNNLGSALQTLGKRESDTGRLEEAVAAYRAALEEYIRDRAPLQWAATQNNLGNALLALGKRESDTERLEQAVAAYRSALKERTRDHVPLQWAMTQNNLGNALRTLGERESGTGRLEEAVATYRAALKERTRDRVPLDWAATQNNLGSALLALGERESDPTRLEETVAAYLSALGELTRDRVPLDWAMTQNNLGNALAMLGEREGDTERLEEAVVAYRAALEEYTRDHAPYQWEVTQNNLDRVLQRLSEKENEP